MEDATFRPNPIGLAAVPLLGRKGNVRRMEERRQG